MTAPTRECAAFVHEHSRLAGEPAPGADWVAARGLQSLAGRATRVANWHRALCCFASCRTPTFRTTMAAESESKPILLGIGNPLLDISAHVSQDYLDK